MPNLHTKSNIPLKLNLGCGGKKLGGFWNVDLSEKCSPDEVVDLNQYPWPWPNDHFSEVKAYDVIEHLENPVMAMSEIHRVCSHGAQIEITVPHFSCANAFTDPTHRHYFGLETFRFFSFKGTFAKDEKNFFTLKRNRLYFYPGLLSRVVGYLANRFPNRYEKRWAWVFPGWFMGIDLQVEKSR